MLRLRVQRATAHNSNHHEQSHANKSVHKPSSRSLLLLHCFFFSPDVTRRFPLINTSAGPGDPFQNSSRTRPSASIFTLPGTALAVTYHPAGSTTAFRGRPRLL